MKNLNRILIWLIVSILVVGGFAMTQKVEETQPYYSNAIALNDKGEILLSQKGLKRLDLFSADGATLLKSYLFTQTPTGVATHNDKAYVTTFDTEGELHILDLTTGNVEAVVKIGSGASYPLLSADKKHLYVCNQFANTVSEIDLSSNKITRTVAVLREPVSAICSKDNRYLFVVNHLPSQRADLDYVAGCVSVVDMKSFKKIKDIQLSNGSNALRGITITDDNKYVYVAHNLGRYTVPTSQLQQGWMNTCAVSVIDVDKLSFEGSIIADEPERGAPGIWDIACNEANLYLVHSGTHEISVIDHKAMRDKFEKYADKSLLDYDLNFLYNIRKRVPLTGNGSRNLVLSDSRLYIPTYFADILNIVDLESEEIAAVELNPGRAESEIDKGERIFNDAAHCFQNWQSCNGCHPGEARVDAMNWDLMNDGIGNPKNCKSLLFSHVTAPSMISGIRASAEVAVAAGFRHIQFYELDEKSIHSVNEYLKALEPVPSPFLVNGELSEKAKEGRKVFDRLDCGSCHSGIYYTDKKMHRIGDDIEFDAGWDTPTLREVWRTAPYLFDGRAETMEDVFAVHKHGINKKVSKKDIEALAEYVNSL